MKIYYNQILENVCTLLTKAAAHGIRSTHLTGDSRMLLCCVNNMQIMLEDFRLVAHHTHLEGAQWLLKTIGEAGALVRHEDMTPTPMYQLCIRHRSNIQEVMKQLDAKLASAQSSLTYDQAQFLRKLIQELQVACLASRTNAIAYDKWIEASNQVDQYLNTLTIPKANDE